MFGVSKLRLELNGIQISTDTFPEETWNELKHAAVSKAAEV